MSTRLGMVSARDYISDIIETNTLQVALNCLAICLGLDLCSVSSLESQRHRRHSWLASTNSDL